MEDPWKTDLAELYARVDEKVAAGGARCELSGRCCDFPTSDHVLYASGLEGDYAVAAVDGAIPPAASGTCPWFVDGLCGLRDGRPMGCRIYFCDPSWADEMTVVYETFHAELKQLHERHGRSYVYGPFVDDMAARREAAL